MMCSTAIRSSLELMLETLQQKEEQPEDLPPALPVRPVSKARLPPARRALPIKFEKGSLSQIFEENEDRKKEDAKSSLEFDEFRSRRTKREELFESPCKQMSEGCADSVVSVFKISILGDTSEKTIQRVLEIQKCFRGHQARSYFLELKSGICTLQSFVRGENARKDYKLMTERLAAATILQKHMRKGIAWRTLQKRQRAVICLQAATRSWLTRRHLRCTENLKEPSIEITEEKRKPDLKNPETKDHVRLRSSVLVDLQRRVLRAGVAIEKKEEENAVLQQQIQQFERKWSQYEEKMKSMEETWQDQLTSLQISLAATKTSLGAEGMTGQQGRVAASPEYYHHNASNTLPMSTKAPPRSTLVKSSGSSDNAGSRQINGQVSVVTHHFESELLASCVNPDIELRKLKLRFEAWKKDYKIRLRETTVTLQKLGLSENEKSHKQWWRI